MRDLVALAVLGVLLGFSLGVMACMLAPSDWHDALHKNPYWPFSVETSVKDR